jgi:hypothetical protein
MVINFMANTPVYYAKHCISLVVDTGKLWLSLELQA